MNFFGAQEKAKRESLLLIIAFAVAMVERSDGKLICQMGHQWSLYQLGIGCSSLDSGFYFLLEALA